jgi:hypothetical protein
VVGCFFFWTIPRGGHTKKALLIKDATAGWAVMSGHDELRAG